MAQKNENNKKKEVIIGVVGVGLLAWWLWPKPATAATTTPTTTTQSLATSTTPVTPSPTYSNTIKFDFTNVQVVPNSYSLELSFIVVNDTPNPVTLSQIVGAVFFTSIPNAQFASQPVGATGECGTVNWPLFNGTPYDTVQTIQPGGNYTRWIPVEVPVSVQAKWTLQNMNLSMTGNSGIVDAPVEFSGYAYVNGQKLAFDVRFDV